MRWPATPVLLGMPGLLVVLGLLAWPTPSRAAGWTDFSLEIAPGFTVWRANSEDVRLLGAKFGPSAEEVGPLVAYAVSPNLILLRHREKVGDLEPHFFRVRRRDGLTLGPLTEAELLARDEVKPLLPVDWTRVAHPRPWEPVLVGMLMLGLLMGSVLLVPLGWLGLLLWLWSMRTRKQPVGPDLLVALLLSSGVALLSTALGLGDAPFPLFVPGLPGSMLGLEPRTLDPLQIIGFFAVVLVAWLPLCLLAVRVRRRFFKSYRRRR